MLHHDLYLILMGTTKNKLNFPLKIGKLMRKLVDLKKLQFFINFLFCSSPLKSCTNYGLALMGLRWDSILIITMHVLQPKITPA